MDPPPTAPDTWLDAIFPTDGMVFMQAARIGN
jgi:hypothetical protein